MNKDKLDIDEKKALCDCCGKPSDNQTYVGYGMMFCKKCVKDQLGKVKYDR